MIADHIYTIRELVEKTTIEESDVHHVIHTHSHHDARMVFVGVIHGRMYPYCITVALRMGVLMQDTEEKFYSFLHAKACKATLEDLIKMALKAAVTGAAFRNHLIDEHRKEKRHRTEDESHATHVASDHTVDFLHDDEVKRFEDIIFHTFKNGQLYVNVFRMHLEGHDNDAINKTLNIHSAHTIKHRIQEVLKKYNQ